MASAITSWSEDNFSCSICLEVFKRPVTTPCGHNFCRTCITKFWDDQVQYKCPLCNELFHTRPDLRVNTLLSEMAAQIKPSVKEEYEVKTAQLGKIESEVQQMIQERKRKIQEIKDTVGRSKADADREIADGEQVLTALISCVEKQRDDFNQTVKEKLKSTEKQAEGLIKELEQEIEDLTNRSSEVKQLTHTEDHLHFLQTFTSLKNPPHTRDWTTVEVRPPSYVGTLRRSLDQLEETLSMEMKKTLSMEMKVPDLKPDACGLTLDLNTAYRRLSLSEDHKKVKWTEEDQYHPDHPERFDSQSQVLCREGLTGRCYWEVERRGGVGIGVTYRGITRRGGGGDSRLGGNNKSWSLYCNDDGRYTAWYNGSSTDIRLPPPVSTRVGVYVDRPAGSLSFYRVSPGVGGSSHTHTLIHTFSTTFTQEDLLPGFRFWSGSGSSVSLCGL
ncbi:E3 ubiquitin-protein ligase TRIM11 [Merluccius polli]|uniref:E3 ubiquitin-protein ligase TRIM11 n=1 Tax=Merluccius polli TaxID=89951 RepID=A0AA47MQJ4_MERPO|nr:E3 ubiquitin-protein ligase TRIM11 [Merluccius polli]